MLFENEKYKLVVDFDGDPVTPREENYNLISTLFVKPSDTQELGDIISDDPVVTAARYLTINAVKCNKNDSSDTFLENVPKTTAELLEEIIEIAMYVPLKIVDYPEYYVIADNLNKFNPKKHQGLAIILKDTVLDRYSSITEASIDDIIVDLKNELAEFNDYLNGYNYIYHLFEKSYCDKCGAEHLDCMAYAYNFHGYDVKDNGIYDDILNKNIISKSDLEELIKSEIEE